MSTPIFTPNTYTEGQVTQYTSVGVGGHGTVIIYAKSKVNGATSPPSLPTWDAMADRYVINSEWDDAVAAYITDYDIVRQGETVLSWPDAQSRLNFATCRFLNESKDFKEDTVSWPNKTPKTSDNDAVYATYYAEDSNTPLETDLFLTGITSEFLAKAKAEHLVRSSRSTILYTFTVNRDYLYLEPGDIVKFQSDVMNLPSSLPEAMDWRDRAQYGDLVIVKEVKPDSNGTIKISAERYDAGVLAWNVVDTEVSVDRKLFNSDLGQASSLLIDTSQVYVVGSHGRLKWTNSTDARVASYLIKAAYNSIPSLNTPWKDLGEATNGALGFDLPNLSDNDYILTVVAKNGTKLAPQKGWPILGVRLEALTPRAITGLEATSNPEKAEIKLKWVLPTTYTNDTEYTDHMTTIIWRSATDNFNSGEQETWAKRVGESVTDTFSDIDEKYDDLYYWVTAYTKMKKMGLPSNMAGPVQFNHFKNGAGIQINPSDYPPAPINFGAVEGFSYISLSWENVPHNIGGGHGNSIVYGAQWFAGIEPVFAEADVLGRPEDPFFVFNGGLGEKWSFWVKEVSKSGVESLLPAGPVIASTAVDVSELIEVLSGQITESALHATLSSRIDLIDAPAIVAASVNGRLATVQQTAATAIAAANDRIAAVEGGFAANTSAIHNLEDVDDTHALQISALGTRADGFGSTILQINETTASQALQISSLSTRTSASETKIETVRLTTVDTAATLTTLSSTVGTAVGNISTLNAVTGDHATTLTNLTGRIGPAESSIIALNDVTSTQAQTLISLNSRTGANESSISTLNTTTATQANSISQVTSTVGGHTTTISQQTTSIDGLKGQYSVKIGAGGYIAGFGLSSEPVAVKESGYGSKFEILADLFSIGSPAVYDSVTNTTMPNTAIIPFIVSPGARVVNGKDVPAGVYMSSAFIADGVITTAKIGDAQVDTLSIAGNSVTVPLGSTAQGYVPTVHSAFPKVGPLINGVRSPGRITAFVTASLGLLSTIPGTSSTLILTLKYSPNNINWYAFGNSSDVSLLNSGQVLVNGKIELDGGATYWFRADQDYTTNQSGVSFDVGSITVITVMR